MSTETFNFTLENTKAGDVKWTRTWTGKNRGRKSVAVDIVQSGTLVEGKTIHIHGVIRATKEEIIIYHSGADSRFWGRTYHTKAQADKYGW